MRESTWRLLCAWGLVKVLGMVVLGVSVCLPVTAVYGVTARAAYNVKDYGAVGDGVNDDTASIQNTLSNAELAGGSQDVFFPPGTYRITSTINPRSNVAMYGSGTGAVIKAGAFMSQMIGYPVRLDNISIRFIEIDGNKLQYPENHGIYMGGTNVTVQGCYAHDTSKAAIEYGPVGNCTNLKMLNNWCHNVGTPSDYWGPFAVVHGDNVLILGNLATTDDYLMNYGFDFAEPTQNKSVSNLVAQYNHVRGGCTAISVPSLSLGVSNVRILDNDIDAKGNKGGGAPIRITDATGTVEVLRNVTRSPAIALGCIELNGISNPLVDSNFCTGMGSDQYHWPSNVGILLNDCTGGSVVNNWIAAGAPTQSGYVAGIKRVGGTAPAYDANHFYNITTPVTDTQTLLGAIFSVKASPYNAAGNGTTDDTNAIQSAINAANSAGGGVVFFPVGTYLCGGLTVKSNVHFRGEGRDAILKAKNSLNSYLIGLPDSSAAVDNVSIRLLTINGNKSNNTSGSMIQFGGSNVIISGMHIYNASDAAINIGNNNTFSNVNIRNNWLVNCGGAILLRSGTNINVIGNIAANTDGLMQYIVKADVASGRAIDSLVVKNNFARGGCIIVQGSGTKSNVAIEENDVDASSAAGAPDGIFVSGCDNVSIQKNAIRCPSTTSAGISLASLSNPTVNYNYITGMGTQQAAYRNNAGIVLANVLGGTVSYNKIFAAAPTQSGYVAGVKTGAGSGQTITGNKFYNITMIAPGPIAATVGLSDYDPVDPSVPVGVRIELREDGQNVLVEQKILEPDGSFAIEDVPAGEYDVAIKACSWHKKVTHIVKGDGAFDMGTIWLDSGDLHGDNECYFTSLSIVLKSFGQSGDE